MNMIDMASQCDGAGEPRAINWSTHSRCRPLAAYSMGVKPSSFSHARFSR